MAEVTGVLREVQLDTEGGFSRRRSKLVKDESAAVGATKAHGKMAVARNKDLATFIGEIGATKAKLANKKASGTSMVKSDFDDTKADAGHKEAAGSITREISVAKSEPGNKEAAGTFTCEIGVDKGFASEIGVTKGFTSEIEIGVTKGFASEIDVTKGFASDIGATKAQKGNKEALGTSDPLAGMKAELGVTKERVSEAYIERIKAYPMRKIPPLSDRILAYDPSRREAVDKSIARINYLVDMEEDCLRQHAEKGYAEVGVDYTSGVKKVFILPN